jgi:hypothetical protein
VHWTGEHLTKRSNFKKVAPEGHGRQPISASIVDGPGLPRGYAMRAKQRLGFLFYPLATEEEPGCPACGQPMDIAVLEVRSNRPSFASFRCQACNRSDRFLIVPFCGPRPKPKSTMKKSWYVVSYESGLSTAGGRYRRQTRSFLSGSQIFCANPRRSRSDGANRRNDQSRASEASSCHRARSLRMAGFAIMVLSLP